MSKTCERCGTKLPDDYGNLLCDRHYFDLVNEEAAKRNAAIEVLKKTPDAAINEEATRTVEPAFGKEGAVHADLPEIPRPVPNFGITDPDYKENPELEDKNQILANLAQFIYSHNPEKGRKGKLLWYPQRNMYTFIKNYAQKKILSHPQYPKYLWKPNVVDVGCGSGVGSNILSLESSFVWGIDKNEWSIEFAKEAFTREKNAIYYSSQVTFDVFDPMVDTRDTMQFDMVVAIEVIEHIYDTDFFLQSLIKKFTKRDKRGRPMGDWNKTEFFFSSPNRRFKKIRNDQPDNPAHVREWKSDELYDYLATYFEEVTIMNQKGEEVSRETDADEVVLFKCALPKV